jgi:hypothetical protein
MESKGCLIEIAFKYDSGGVDELLVIGIMCHGMLIKSSQRAQRPQIEIDNTVRFRKKPGDLRRRLFAKVDRGN